LNRSRNNRLLRLAAPPATPLRTSQYLDACHRTVSYTGVCTGPYRPDQLTARKTAFGGRLLYNDTERFRDPPLSSREVSAAGLQVIPLSSSKN
jgi:hypothetical protein